MLPRRHQNGQETSGPAGDNPLPDPAQGLEEAQYWVQEILPVVAVIMQHLSSYQSDIPMYAIRTEIRGVLCTGECRSPSLSSPKSVE